MGDIELLSSHRRARSEDIVGDIRFALKCLGGAAHIDTITATVEAKLRAEKGEAFRNIAADIEAALYAYELNDDARAKTALFKRPYGKESKRWALHHSPMVTSRARRVAE